MGCHSGAERSRSDSPGTKCRGTKGGDRWAEVLQNQSMLFTPLTLRGVTLKNRVVMSPMNMYSGTSEGRPTDFHLVHYGALGPGRGGPGGPGGYSG